MDINGCKGTLFFSFHPTPPQEIGNDTPPKPRATAPRRPGKGFPPRQDGAARGLCHPPPDAGRIYSQCKSACAQCKPIRAQCKPRPSPRGFSRTARRGGKGGRKGAPPRAASCRERAQSAKCKYFSPDRKPLNVFLLPLPRLCHAVPPRLEPPEKNIPL